jgi:hypothetical protein
MLHCMLFPDIEIALIFPRLVTIFFFELISSYIKQHGFNPTAFDNYREKHIITIGKKALNA